MNKNVIIVIVLVVLVLLTAVQAIQLSSLKTSLSSGKVKAGSQPVSSGHQSTVAVPSNIQDLPSMVGGC